MKYIVKFQLPENNIRGIAIISTILMIVLDFITINGHVNAMFNYNKTPNIKKSIVFKKQIVKEDPQHDTEEYNDEFIVEDILSNYSDDGFAQDILDNL